MYHLLILYNPYYKNDVIESHLEILKRKRKVAFGKLKSPLRNSSTLDSDPKTDNLAHLESTTESTPKITPKSAQSPIDSNDSHTLESSIIECQESHAKDSHTISHAPKSEIAKSPTLETLAHHTSVDSPLQLFLTDYASLFVAKVTRMVASEELSEQEKRELESITPSYYASASLNVELWLIIEDMRELVRNDFVRVRDSLANFTTPHNGNHTYALYGNAYTYPLIVQSKKEAWYFRTHGDFRADSRRDLRALEFVADSNAKADSKRAFKADSQALTQDSNGALPHYHSIFKSEEQIAMRERLIDYALGERAAGLLDVDCMDNLVSAELEYQANKGNPLYDSTGIVMWYARTFELELAAFMRAFLSSLSLEDEEILELIYNVQGKSASVQEWLELRAEIEPNLGAYRYLLQNVRNTARIWQSAKPKSHAPAQRTKNQAQNHTQNNAHTHKDSESLSPLALKLGGLERSLDSKNGRDSQAGQNLTKTPTPSLTQNLSQNLTRSSPTSSPAPTPNLTQKQSPTQKYGALDSLSTLPTRFDIVSLACHKIPRFIEIVQSIRNPAAHSSKPTITQAKILRAQILGIEGESLLCALCLARMALECGV